VPTKGFRTPARGSTVPLHSGCGALHPSSLGRRGSRTDERQVRSRAVIDWEAILGCVLIAQITDLHIDEPGGFMRRFVDANSKLERAIDYLHTRVERPDAVLATGDLTNDGRPEQFDLLRALLDRLEIPIYLIPGNHDEREGFRSTFSDRPWMPASGPIDYVIEDFPVRLVGMDTSEPDRHDGTLDDGQLAWLDATLSREPSRPTLLFLHHPPFLSGLWLFDAIRLGGSQALRTVVEGHPQVTQIIAGHVHRPISYHWGATMITTCPSTTHQSRCDLDPEEGAGVTDDSPMLQLHRWTGEGFITHTTPFEPATATIEISESVSDWDSAKKRILAGPPFPKGAGGVF
jgi:Icc protein